MWDRFKDWLARPFSSDMDALGWFLFFGLLIAVALGWRLVLGTITDVLKGMRT